MSANNFNQYSVSGAGASRYRQVTILFLTTVFAVISVFAGCRGADELPEEWLTESNGSATTDTSGVAVRLSCPEPGALPFALESDGFESATLQSEPDHVLFDAIVNEGDEQTVSGIATYGSAGNMTVNPLAGEYVSLWYYDTDSGWQMLSRGLTDAAGGFSYTLTAEQQFGYGAHEIYMVVEGDGTCAGGGIFVYRPGTQIVVTDIDETMTVSDAEIISQMSNRDYVPAMRPAANEMMQLYAEKGYYIFFLTARPYHLRLFSRNWLDDFEFPFSYMETADSFVFGESASNYKGDFIDMLTDDLGYEVIAAYGNAESDIIGYENGGIPKNITFIIGPEAGNGGTNPIAGDGFSTHINEYVVNVPDAEQP